MNINPIDQLLLVYPIHFFITVHKFKPEASAEYSYNPCIGLVGQDADTDKVGILAVSFNTTIYSPNFNEAVIAALKSAMMFSENYKDEILVIETGNSDKPTNYTKKISDILGETYGEWKWEK